MPIKIPAAIAAAAVLLAPAHAHAQDDTNARILAVVDAYFRALNENDAALQESVSTERGMLVSHNEGNPSGEVRFRTFEEDLEAVATETRSLREVYWEPTVLVRGNIAVVWAEYSFDVEGERSHCGIDVVNLMRIEGEWKVTGIQYTVEPDNCPEGR